MSQIYKRLKIAEAKRKREATLTLDHDHIDKSSEDPTQKERARIEKELVEELLTGRRRIRLKVTCPQCKKNISMRCRVKLKS
ncbi:MAG: hypothetical protein GTO24_09970 [candidate division Zixibacteria bacterium]|nr:hypothetical protein [candidate division Zixibacteria bacterium]